MLPVHRPCLYSPGGGKLGLAKGETAGEEVTVTRGTAREAVEGKKTVVAVVEGKEGTRAKGKGKEAEGDLRCSPYTGST